MRKKRMLPLLVLGLVGVVGLTLSGCKGGGDENVAKGQKLYLHYCAHCHGELGDGNGFNAKYVDPPPANHTDPDMAKRSNEKIFKTISKGGKGAAKSAKMPPFGKVLSEKAMWQLVAYIRTLHPNSAPAISFEGLSNEKPKYVKAARYKLKFPDMETKEWAKLVKKGRKLYRRVGCKACHRMGEDGGRVGPELSRVGYRLRPKWMFMWLKSPQSIYKKTKMPNFNLKDKDARAIVAFLTTQKAVRGAKGSRGDPGFLDESIVSRLDDANLKPSYFDMLAGKGKN